MNFPDLLLDARRSLLLAYGKIRYRFVSRRLLIAGAVASLLGAAWVAFASVHLIVSKQIIAGMAEDQERQRIAYVELLGAASERHDQFSRLTRDLQDNQAYLLSLLSSRGGDDEALAEIESRLKVPTGEPAGLAPRPSEAGVANPWPSEAQAENHLGRRLERVQAELAEVQKEKGALLSRFGRLNQELANAEYRARVLAREKATLGGNLDEQERRLSQAGERQSHLEEQIADLESSLDEAVRRGEGLEEDRALLNTRVAGLESDLISMGLNHQAIVKRLSERTLFSIDAFEKTIATTGIDVDSLLSARPVSFNATGNAAGSVDDDQGGPFIPGDTIVQEDPVFSLRDSFARLNLQMDRWDGLQALIGALPLAPPLDTFRVTSKFGQRRDPFTSRKSNHYGLDLGAPMKTSVLATAPGQVVFAGRRGHYGRMVEVDHGFGITTRYGHLLKTLVKVGREVSHGETIGLVGSTGRSTGPHLHYEVRVNGKPHDPVKFINAGPSDLKG